MFIKTSVASVHGLTKLTFEISVFWDGPSPAYTSILCSMFYANQRRLTIFQTGATSSWWQSSRGPKLLAKVKNLLTGKLPLAIMAIIISYNILGCWTHLEVRRIFQKITTKSSWTQIFGVPKPPRHRCFWASVQMGPGCFRWLQVVPGGYRWCQVVLGGVRPGSPGWFVIFSLIIQHSCAVHNDITALSRFVFVSCDSNMYVIFWTMTTFKGLMTQDCDNS